MAAAENQYIVDVNAQNCITIHDTCIQMKHIKKYKYNTDLQHSVGNSNNANEMKNFQKQIRIFDMIKDGKVTGVIDDQHVSAISQNTICELMNGPGGCENYSRFKDILNKLRDNVKDNIVYTTWIHPNERFESIRKLDTRTTYKESGLSPQHIITNPIYCSNLATEVIDPLRRTYQNTTGVQYFPEIGSKIVFTPRLFDYFGLDHCQLDDRRIATGDHKYTLQIGEGYTLTQDNNRRKNNNNNNKTISWYAGNKTKNKYFNEHPTGHDDVKKALLNVKELGDVLQVLYMLANVHINKSQTHTMVTGDQVVFALCTQLNLDCILYYYTSNLNHQILHFKSAGGVNPIQAHFEKTKNDILSVNQGIIDSILEILLNEHINIYSTKVNFSENFRLPPKFLKDIIMDMLTINSKLRKLTPQGNINREFINDMKRKYQLKVPFSKSNTDTQMVLFLVSYTSYTSYTTVDPKDGYHLEGYDGTEPFYTIFSRHYRSKTGGGIDNNIKKIKTEFWKRKELNNNLIDFIELTTYPVNVVVKDKYFEEEGIDPNTHTRAATIDIRNQWDTDVNEKIKRKTAFFPDIFKYINDIKWELYHSYYISSEVEDDIDKRLNDIIAKIEPANTKIDESKAQNLKTPVIQNKSRKRKANVPTNKLHENSISNNNKESIRERLTYVGGNGGKRRTKKRNKRRVTRRKPRRSY